jgi:molecular chaperone GrpE
MRFDEPNRVRSGSAGDGAAGPPNRVRGGSAGDGAAGSAGGTGGQIPIRDRRKIRTDVSVEATAAASSGDSGSVGAQAEATSAAASTDQTTTGQVMSGQAQAEAEKLRQEVEEARSQSASYLDDLQRLKAEFDNYRKRTIKEQTGLIDRASAIVISQLLGVLDNFELAVAAAAESKDFDSMLKGVEMVFSELNQVLSSAGLEAIDAHGKPFDPRVHDAVLEVPGDDSGVTVVDDVFRKGYTFKDYVLRPAMVRVTQKGEAPATDQATDEEQEEADS